MRHSSCLPAVLLAAALIALAPPLPAEGRKIALVIGNSAYETGPLRNPANDASDLAAVLRTMGFTVSLGLDADRGTMYRLVDRFGAELQDAAELALFYYSGHAVQAGGENFLIPVKAEISVAADVEIEGVQLGRVLARMMAGEPGTSIVILDACRNNPFPQASRGMERGLAVVGQKPPESVIVYATEAGETADDGSGRNGVFTAALLKHLGRKEELSAILRDVNAEVRESTNQRQRPVKYDNLTKPVYLAGQPAPAPTAPTAPAAAPATPTAPAARPNAGLEALLEEKVGRSEVSLEGRRELVRVSESNLGRLLAEAIRFAAGADVAMINGGGLRDSIPAGPISRRQVLKVLPFGNKVVSVRVTGAELAAMVEHGLAKLPEADGRFPHFSNLKYRLTASNPPGSRASSITIGKRPLDPTAEYLLATIDFLLLGGDGYPNLGGRDYNTLGIDSEILIAYLRSAGTLTQKSLAP